VQAAERFGMTLLGFVRQQRYNIYAHPWRIVAPAAPPSVADPKQEGKE
jgi:FdhD protein